MRPEQRVLWRALGDVKFRPEELRQLNRHQVEWVAIQRSQDEGLHICEKCASPSFTRYCRKCGKDCFGKECGNTRICGRPASLDDVFCGHCGYEFPVYAEGIHTLSELAEQWEAGTFTPSDLDKLFPEKMPEDEFAKVASTFEDDGIADEQMAFRHMAARAKELSGGG